MLLDLIDFNYHKSKNQEGLFTPRHTKFECTITYRGKKLAFDYQCNTKYSQPTKANCIECLLGDASCYMDFPDIVDFLIEFGYNTSKDGLINGRDAYNACAKTHEEMNDMFTDQELYILQEEINNLED